ncbi:MAG: hypothetical protein NTU53_12855 [Planctomycetota bacterium]|nr:hypothetical protein [Planctomycetota bacterium]
MIRVSDFELRVSPTPFSRYPTPTMPLAFLLFESSPDTRLLLTLLIAAFCTLPLSRLTFLHRPFSTLAHNRPLSYALIFLLTLLLVSSLSLKRGLPLPYVHDEFSNLLAADTFAHGRLTNPPHPLWPHFESMHILVRPTYQSKYPPAQALFMALGQITTHRPITGIWLTTALAAAAICYALHPFLPPRYALLGGLLAALHPQLLEWGQRYWGASIPTLASALLLGSLARLFPHAFFSPTPTPRHSVAPSPFLPALLLALALILLANSRPYEGLVFTLLLFTTILITLLHRRLSPPPIPHHLTTLSSVSIGAPSVANPSPNHPGNETGGPKGGPRGVSGHPAGGNRGRKGGEKGVQNALLTLTLPILCLAAIWMAYYNYRITGHPLRLPYLEHHSQYGSVPLFIFQPRPTRKTYLHSELDYFLVHEQDYWYNRRDSGYKLTKEALRDLTRLKEGSFGNVEVLALPLLILPWLLTRNRTLRLLTLLLFLFVCSLLLETYCFAHYAAPATPLVVLILLLCLRRLSHLAPPLGSLLTRLTIALFLLSSTLWFQGFYNWKQEGFPLARHQILTQLQNTPNTHLVIVRYKQHNVHEEWVYNEADIDSAKVIWAREMDTASNRKLLDCFKDRKAWLLEPDTTPPRLQEYPHGRN